MMYQKIPLVIYPDEGKYNIYLSHLLNYVFQTDMKEDEFIQRIPEIASYSIPNKLQALEIAINEGTTKSWLSRIL